MSYDQLEKIEILIQQNKFEEAEKMLSVLLGKDQENISYLSLLVELKLNKEEHDQANQLIDRAIGIEPDNAYLYNLKGRVLIQKEETKKAEEYLHSSIAIDPYYANSFSLLAVIKIEEKKFVKALEYADQALSIDPEDLLALNMRSTALTKLQRTEESIETMEGTLNEDPNNSFSHSNIGWNFLEKGDHKKAKSHFKEALKLDPNNDFAKGGLLEAIKATNPIYRYFLKYSFWMQNKTAKLQWVIIIGVAVGIRGMRMVADKYEAYQPYIIPVISVLVFFVFSSWFISPISNLILRFNKYGNLLLEKTEKIISVIVGFCLITFLIAISIYGLTDAGLFLFCAVFGLSMIIPLGTITSDEKNMKLIILANVVLACLGLFTIYNAYILNIETFNRFLTFYAFGIIGYQWVYNFISVK